MEMLRFSKFLLFKQFRPLKSVRLIEDKTNSKYLLKTKIETFKASSIQIKLLILSELKKNKNIK
jgi:hypothetical protein